MSESGGISWGKVLAGAAVVTAVVAAAVFIPGMDRAITGATGFVGDAISGVGSSISNIGQWIAGKVGDIAGFANINAGNKALALGAAAATGAIGVAATTSFVDRINRSTAPITGRE